jgi:hypothetical protein
LDKVSGLAQKTYTYRMARMTPGMKNLPEDAGAVSVSDRIAQRLAAGASTGYDATMGVPLISTFDYVPNIGVATAEGLTANVPQENSWFYQRLIEAFDPTVTTRTMAGRAYPLDSEQTAGVIRGTADRSIIGELAPEGKRIGAKYKPVAESIDQDVIDLANSRASQLTQLTPATTYEVLQYAPTSRPGYRNAPQFDPAKTGPVVGDDVPEAALAFGRNMAGLFEQNRRGYITPEVAALMLAAGTGGLLGAKAIGSRMNQQGSATPAAPQYGGLEELARRNAARRTYKGGIR